MRAEINPTKNSVISDVTQQQLRNRNPIKLQSYTAQTQQQHYHRWNYCMAVVVIMWFHDNYNTMQQFLIALHYCP